MKKVSCPKCGNKMISNGKSGAGNTRWVCYGSTGRAQRQYCYSTVNPGSSPITAGGTPVEAEIIEPSNFTRKLGGVKKLVITSAQNSTPVNKPFFESLLTYCEVNDAELIVVPYRYKNPTSSYTESQRNEEHWAPILKPYLYNQRKKLCANLILLADIKTQPTAVSPLTGFEGITHGESGIVGHPKMQMKVIPTPSHSQPKIMHTTGSVTVKNYTDTKAGKKGEFHHCMGAVVVEIVGKKFHLRQINATDDGSFIDWDTVRIATFSPGGIIGQLQPKHLIWHDLLDGYSRNHHHTGNVFTEMSKRGDGREMHLVGKEVQETIAFLKQQTINHHCKSIVVQSNHDDFLRQWIMNDNWKYDPDNAEFYLETALAMTRSVGMSERGAECVNPFAYWVDKACAESDHPGCDVRCLGTDESFELKGVELGLHGHRGANGARGSIKGFSQIGVKTITGHSHTPGIEGGAYKAGTSTNLRLEYTEGPSSWMNSHVVLYANGKRAIINIIDGEFKRD